MAITWCELLRALQTPLTLEIEWTDEREAELRAHAKSTSNYAEVSIDWEGIERTADFGDLSHLSESSTKAIYLTNIPRDCAAG